MRNLFLLLLLIFTVGIFTQIISNSINTQQKQISGAPPYGESLEEVPETVESNSPFANWVRPDVPPTVGLQVGHWKNEELPQELERLKGSTGASAVGLSEWEVNYEIAIRTKQLLEEQGIVVDLIPATVPVNYWADAFIAIHADGSLDAATSGYKIAGPWRDYLNNSSTLVEFLDTAYDAATTLPKDPNISRNMRGYYAFSWWRFDHAIHPMTSAAIVETGFLTSWNDRQLIVDNPDVSAQAIVDGTVEFLENQGILL